MSGKIDSARVGCVIRDSNGRAYSVSNDGSLQRLHPDVAAEMEAKGAERRRFLLVRPPPSSKYDAAGKAR